MATIYGCHGEEHMAIRTIEYEVLPARSDPSVFSLTIEYNPLTESPGRLLRSTAHFVDSFAILDAAFATAIDPNMETTIALLGIEQGSIRAWLASLIRSFDDEAIRDLDWKKLIGAYLVRAKYRSLEWLEADQSNKKLIDLQAVIVEEASKTDALLIPAYHPPSRALLLDGLRRAQLAKDGLLDADTITYDTGLDQIQLDPEHRLDLTQIRDVEIQSIEKHDLHRASLKVKKPDLLGHSQWQLKFHDRTVPSAIEDHSWLSRFQSREVTLRPGDALICDGQLTRYFDKSGTPVSEKVEVTKIHGIEYQAPPQDDMF